MTDLTALDLAAVQERVARYRPSVRRWTSGWQAATALIVTPGPGGLDVAFIEKTTRTDDRWSGQMALPGGRWETGDADLAATAIRETHEEVGLTLPGPIGRLDDQGGRVHRGVVATFVFTVDGRPPLQPDLAEVARAMWIPLAHLFDPAAGTRIRWAGLSFPGIDHDGQVIWGLTHRIIGSFAAALGLRLPSG